MDAHRTAAQLDRHLDDIRAAPSDGGELMMIVARPEVGERTVVESATLDVERGLVGDNWKPRGSRSTSDGSADPLRQLTVMTTRSIEAITGDRGRWPLAGDQMFVDIDLSDDNLPAGTRLTLGSAVIEITEPPHTGCKKFIERFGRDAMRWVNDETGRALRLRGANARVVQPGTIRVGDRLTKVNADR